MLCNICHGNGEVVTDWDRHLTPREGDLGDEAVAECDQCFGSGLNQDLFDDWLRHLNDDVIEAEYGYVSGEFSVIPELWEPLYREGLTPAQAFKRALDAAAEARHMREAEQKERWSKIREADAKFLSEN